MSDEAHPGPAAADWSNASSNQRDNGPLFARHAHTREFPANLWQELKQFASHPLRNCSIPKFGRSSDAAVVKQLLLKILESKESSLNRSIQRNDRNAKVNVHDQQQNIQSIRLAISYIESWQLAEGESRRGQQTSNQSAIHIRNEDCGVSGFTSLPTGNRFPTLLGTDNSSQATSSMKTLDLLVYIIIENPFVDAETALKQRTKTAVTLRDISYEAPIATVLRVLGATNPKLDVLSFRRLAPAAGRDRNGLPLVIPAKYKLIGWPGSPWADGEKVQFRDLMNHNKKSRNSKETWDLECTYKRAWVDVKDESKEIYVSGRSACDSRGISDFNFIGRNPALPEDGMIPLGPIGQPIQALMSGLFSLYGKDFPNRGPLEEKFINDCGYLMTLYRSEPRNYLLIRQLILYLNQKVEELEDGRENERVEAAEQLSLIAPDYEPPQLGYERPPTRSTVSWQSESDIGELADVTIGSQFPAPLPNPTNMIAQASQSIFRELPMLPDKFGGITPPGLFRYRYQGKNAHRPWEHVPNLTDSPAPSSESHSEGAVDHPIQGASTGKHILRTAEDVEDRYTRNLRVFQAIDRDPATIPVSQWCEEVETARQSFSGSRLPDPDVPLETDFKRKWSSSPGEIRSTAVTIDKDKLKDTSRLAVLVGPVPQPKRKETVRPLFSPSLLAPANTPGIALPTVTGYTGENPGALSDSLPAFNKLPGTSNDSYAGEPAESNGASPFSNPRMIHSNLDIQSEDIDLEELALSTINRLSPLLRSPSIDGNLTIMDRSELDHSGMDAIVRKAVEEAIALEQAKINDVVKRSVEAAMAVAAQRFAVVVAEAVGPLTLEIEQLKNEITNIQNKLSIQPQSTIKNSGGGIGTIVYGLGEEEGHVKNSKPHAILPLPVRKGKAVFPPVFAERLDALWHDACRNVNMDPYVTTMPDEIREFLLMNMVGVEGRQKTGYYSQKLTLRELMVKSCALYGIDAFNVQMTPQIYTAVFCHQTPASPGASPLDVSQHQGALITTICDQEVGGVEPFEKGDTTSPGVVPRHIEENEDLDEDWDYNPSVISAEQHQPLQAHAVRIHQMDGKHIRPVNPTGKCSAESSIAPSDSISNKLTPLLFPAIPAPLSPPTEEAAAFLPLDERRDDETVFGPIAHDFKPAFLLTRDDQAILPAGTPSRIQQENTPFRRSVKPATESFGYLDQQGKSKSDSAPDPWLSVHEQEGVPSAFRDNSKSALDSFTLTSRPLEAAPVSWPPMAEPSLLCLDSPIPAAIGGAHFPALTPRRMQADKRLAQAAQSVQNPMEDIETSGALSIFSSSSYASFAPDSEDENHRCLWELMSATNAAKDAEEALASLSRPSSRFRFTW